MRKCLVEWSEGERGKRTWRCSYYLMCHGIEFRESSDRCYHFKCPGRADIPSQLVEPSIVDEKVCSEDDCDNLVAPNRREHCSERCRKRMNRRHYIERKRALKA